MYSGSIVQISHRCDTGDATPQVYHLHEMNHRREGTSILLSVELFVVSHKYHLPGCQSAHVGCLPLSPLPINGMTPLARHLPTPKLPDSHCRHNHPRSQAARSDIALPMLWRDHLLPRQKRQQCLRGWQPTAPAFLKKTFQPAATPEMVDATIK